MVPVILLLIGSSSRGSERLSGGVAGVSPVASQAHCFCLAGCTALGALASVLALIPSYPRLAETESKVEPEVAFHLKVSTMAGVDAGEEDAVRVIENEKSMQYEPKAAFDRERRQGEEDGGAAAFDRERRQGEEDGGAIEREKREESVA
ncbi:hypothetical protein L2E82_28558 [Cichorium intybus]|uniref:Uncharacterized protein n=1 Tax=Cichorium intybus TaxID=13427 RepID=A0ACB9CW26_CICIN|nr:hypothetical protein L2E82_28558 [Cichorium intybus]